MLTSDLLLTRSRGPYIEPRYIDAADQKFIDLAQALEIPFVETNLDPYDVYTADEAFFCSTSFAIMPIRTVDDHRISEGIPGPVTQRIIDAFSDDVGIDFIQQARELFDLPEPALAH